jgi:cytochrome c oxidase cbb3-type subunit 3
MSDIDEKRLMHHEYDGIQEYDNPLPGWWKWIFVGTILFAVVYFVWYHLGGPGVSETDAYKAEVAAHFAEMSKRGGQVKVTEEVLAGLLQNKELIASTTQLYKAKCAQCHGQKGEGGIGPNMTDDYYIHGGKLMDLYTVIDKGVPAKGMLAWGKLLKPGELMNLTAYMASLRGTNPPNQKAPQGEKVTP